MDCFDTFFKKDMTLSTKCLLAVFSDAVVRESPVLQHPRGVPLDLDLATGKATVKYKTYVYASCLLKKKKKQV